jgi:putative NIF3 family GTP cyclohydrolase 1 type 2
MDVHDPNKYLDCPHTAVDAALGGINDWLADMLDGHGVTTKRSVLRPIMTPVPLGFEGSGPGRLVELEMPVHLGRIAEAYAKGLGGLRYIMIAQPKHSSSIGGGKNNKSHFIRSVGICAGSGHEVLKDCKADLLVTGEMSHHEALRATMTGQCVLTVFHSNSERGFLRQRLQPELERILRTEDREAEVLVSDEDEDPFEIWDGENMPTFT